ncbi:uncharacterized protein FFNC_02993 [Fusarium fujikuroi]|nr:uncharacterized protein FFNC_02993 [Fusarium fujikuroi]
MKLAGNAPIGTQKVQEVSYRYTEVPY